MEKNAATTSEKDAQMFPDLHKKMSKKIAQLTRVIYQLNCRNEDSHEELDAMATRHEKDMEEIMKDAADKINRFKSRLAKQKKDAKTAEAIEALKKKHRKEKDEALQALADLKKRSKQQQREIHKTMQARLALLQKEVSDVRAGFEKKKSALQKDADRKKDQLLSMKKKASRLEEELNRVRAETDMNLEETKRTHASHSSQMQEQIDILRKKLEQSEEARRNDAELAQKTMSQSEEAQNAKEKEMHEIRSSLVGKIEKLLMDNEALRKSENDLRGEVSATLEMRDKQAAELSTLREKSRITDADLIAARKQIESSESKVRDVLSEIVDSRKSNEELKSVLNSLRDEMGKLEEQRAKDATESAKVKRELESKLLSIEKELLEATATHRSSLEASLRASENLESKVSELEASNARLSEKKSELERLLSSERETTKQLRADLERLQKSTESAALERSKRADAMLASVRASSAEQEKVLKDRIAALNQTLSEVREEGAAAMKQTNAEWKGILESSSREKDEEITSLRSTEARLRSELESLRKQSESSAAASSSQVADLRATSEALRARVLELEKSEAERIASHQASLRNMKSSSSELEATLRRQLAESESSLSAERKSTSALKEERARLESRVASLSSEIESTRSEIESLRSQSDETMRDVRESYEKKIEEVRRSSEREAEAKLAKLREKFEVRFGTMASDHALRSRSIASAISAARNAAASSAVQSLCAEHRITICMAEKKVARLNQDLANALVSSASSSESKLLAARQEWQKMLKDRVADLKRAARLHSTTAAAAAVARLSGVVAELSATVAGLHANYAERLKVGREVAESDLKQLEASMRKEHANVVATLRGQHDAVSKELRMQISNQSKDLKSAVERSESLSSELAELRRALDEARKIGDHLTSSKESAIAELRSEYESVMKTMRIDHKKNTDSLIDEHLKETETLSQEFALAQEAMMKRGEADAARIASMQERWETRASRPEDIERIKKLESLATDQRKQLTSLLEKMRFYKRELVNRDKNFSKMFGQKDFNVGVMNVLKAPPPQTRKAGMMHPNQRGSSGPLPKLAGSYARATRADRTRRAP